MPEMSLAPNFAGEDGVGSSDLNQQIGSPPTNLSVELFCLERQLGGRGAAFRCDGVEYVLFEGLTVERKVQHITSLLRHAARASKPRPS
jgi:hypothetical protein